MHDGTRKAKATMQRDQEQRRWIRGAKSRLMRELRIDEPEAHRTLQFMAMDNRMPMPRCAQMVADGRLPVRRMESQSC